MRAAAYHGGSVVLELITSEKEVAAGTEARFRRVTGMLVPGLRAADMAAALAERLGVSKS